MTITEGAAIGVLTGIWLMLVAEWIWSILDRARREVRAARRAAELKADMESFL